MPWPRCKLILLSHVVLKIKDGYTALHSQHVAELSTLIGQALALEPQLVVDLHISGLLHDLGKLQLPKAILAKSASLTLDEYARVKGHPAMGFTIAKKLQLNERILYAILHHHERLDGTGYPNCISGAQISLPAQIIGIADIYDAMTTNRPYRAALPREAAFEFLADGQRFNQSIVYALKGVV